VRQSGRGGGKGGGSKPIAAGKSGQARAAQPREEEQARQVQEPAKEVRVRVREEQSARKGFSLGNIDWVLEAVESVQKAAEPAALIGVKAIAAGTVFYDYDDDSDGYTFALTESGEVYAWGINTDGQLGLGDTEDRLMPTKVPDLTKVKAIAVGGCSHVLVLTESGEVYAWGWNGAGQLGLGDKEDRLTPTKVPGLARVKAIAAGGCHSLALTESGEVYSWGFNGTGELGLGDWENRLTPTKVPGLEGVKAIACGYIHSLALTASGKVYRWGLHCFHSDEAILNRPSKVPELDGIVAVIGGGWCSFALTESGDVYAWGDNKYWQLGLGDTECRLVPTKVPGLAGVKAIAGGSFRGGPHHYLALTQSGEVYAWGCNDKGQLGLGDTQWRTKPTKVPGLSAVKASAAGWKHSLALTESGEIYGWGANGYGQLGVGDTQDRLTPTKVGPSKPTR
jgi:alpha-tubulin suppressor-like RCC1 family protein